MAIDYEERHTTDTKCPCVRLICSDILCVASRSEDLVGLGTVETALFGQPDECFMVRDCFAVTDVGQKEPFFQRVLSTHLERIMQQPVCIEGARPSSPIEIELQPLLSRHSRQSLLGGNSL